MALLRAAQGKSPSVKMQELMSVTVVCWPAKTCTVWELSAGVLAAYLRAGRVRENGIGAVRRRTAGVEQARATRRPWLSEMST